MTFSHPPARTVASLAAHTSVIARARVGAAAALLLPLVLAAPSLSAEELKVHGSSTFNRTILQPFKSLIEAGSGHTLRVIASRSGLGLIDLLEGRADIAMISAPFESEIEELRKRRPHEPYDQLQVFEISRTSAAMIVHSTNPVERLTQDQIRRILFGEITNWSELGGPSRVIRPVAVPDEGGVTQNVINSVLGGKPIRNKNAIRVDTPIQVVKVVAQEPGALGLAQLRLSKDNAMKLLILDRQVSQVLSFVTKGPPTPAMSKLIAVARSVAEKNLAEAPQP